MPIQSIMSVDLSSLIPVLRREVSPPGTDLFPDATSSEWLGNLQDGFWETILDGVISGYTEASGLVTPVSGTTELARELQQVVVFYAGYRIVRNVMRQLNTQFRAKAGPVEYETQQSANLLVAVFKELKEKRDLLLTRLSDLGAVPSYYIDAVIQRNDMLMYSDQWWVR
jgi:hypothetical protein